VLIACSSERDARDNSFWPLGVLQNDKATTLAHDGDTAVTQARAKHGPLYSKHRESNDYGGVGEGFYRDDNADHPDCFGSCFVGACQLDQSRPGCCYAHAHNAHYASGDASFVEADAPEEVAGYRASDTMVAVAGRYRGHGAKRALVCWQDESDAPHIVHLLV
jgi:hypothetical protein